MKLTTKIMIAAIVCAVMSALACTGKETPITVKQLPLAAQQTVNTHFKTLKVVIATKERDMLGYEYEVKFADGTKIDFDSKGQWTDIDCRTNAVPKALVPAQISKYVADNYRGQKIVQIERDSKGYEIELGNKTEIDFNKKFQVVKIDR